MIVKLLLTLYVNLSSVRMMGDYKKVAGMEKLKYSSPRLDITHVEMENIF
ncbi:hypothetical protein [Elizabethkingia meningoseptica]